ncbi:hypothetical protein BH18ACT8_BH18ACT8_13050 [soil metagenome]
MSAATQAAELTGRLIRRAALDGSTALRASVLATALRGYGIAAPVPGLELAEETGRVVTLPDEGLVALPEVAQAEQTVAAEVLRLLGTAEPQLSLVIHSGGEAPPGATMVADAHRLHLSEAAELLRATVPGHPLMLVCDPDELQPDGPGRPFADLVASGLVPVSVQPFRGSERPHIAHLLSSVRAGRLLPVPRDQREVVLVPAADAAQTLTRVRQLVTSSIPKSLSVPSSDTLVLTVRAGGSLGVEALRSALSTAEVEVEVTSVAAAAGRRARAVVLVLAAEAAGSLSRAMLVSALSIVGEHVSIVHQVGPALAEAVQRRPHRPRLTRLPALLRAAGGSLG